MSKPASAAASAVSLDLWIVAVWLVLKAAAPAEILVHLRRTTRRSECSGLAEERRPGESVQISHSYWFSPQSTSGENLSYWRERRKLFVPFLLNFLHCPISACRDTHRGSRLYVTNGEPTSRTNTFVGAPLVCRRVSPLQKSPCLKTNRECYGINMLVYKGSFRRPDSRYPWPTCSPRVPGRLPCPITNLECTLKSAGWLARDLSRGRFGRAKLLRRRPSVPRDSE